MRNRRARSARTNRERYDQAISSRETEALGIPLPAIVVHVRRVQSEADGQAAPFDPPILYPYRPAKAGAGRDLQTSMERALSRALAVYGHIALRLLQAQGKTLLHAEPSVQKAAGQSSKSLLKISATALSELTGFDNNEGVVAWATRPDSSFVLPRTGTTVANEGSCDRALEVLNLISAGLGRTKRVVRAMHETQLSTDREVSAAFAEAFRAGVALDSLECFRLAMAADINPAPLWRAHSQYAQVFELARFVGRVDRGGLALLPLNHVASIERALVDTSAEIGSDLCIMQQLVREAIAFHFGVDRFRPLLLQARSTGGLIVVDRRTRRLRCRTDAGLMARIFGRQVSWK